MPESNHPTSSGTLQNRIASELGIAPYQRKHLPLSDQEITRPFAGNAFRSSAL